MDEWGNELPVMEREQINHRFDKGSERMAAIERGVNDANRGLGENNAELAKTRQELHELKQQLADFLEFFVAMKGAIKVFNWVGKLAKPAAAIVGLGASVMAAYAAWRGVR